VEIEFDGYRPGCLADIVGLHARYYAKNWGFGLKFESKVANELAEYLQRMDSQQDLFLTAYQNGNAIASISVDVSNGGPRGAHLRWFIVSGEARGSGLGKKLMQKAMDFCHDRNIENIWLTTFAGLSAARALYEHHGFTLACENDTDQWSGGVREQLFECSLKSLAE
jgi:GNAT superfamily N-acetyltransferase